MYTDLKNLLESWQTTSAETICGVPYFIGEFWTARQRQAHRIQEISYRACFKPQLPAFFIERLTVPGETVYDPFMGRGTTPIEAALRRRMPYGNDANPLSRAFTEPRINPPSLAQIKARLNEIDWKKFREVENEELLVFYHPKTLAHIEGLRNWFLEREEAGLLDQTDRWIRMVALNRLTGHSSGYFSVYTLPPNQAVSVEKQHQINERLGQIPPFRDVRAAIAKKSRNLLSQSTTAMEQSLFLTHHGQKDQSSDVCASTAAEKPLFLTGPSHTTPQIAEASVSLTVTSPPFLDVVNYEADNWLRCWFLGVDPQSIGISHHRNLDDWQNFVRLTLVELARITRPRGHVAFEVGEVRNGSVRLEENVIAAAEGLPFKILGVMVNRQKFTKTSNCWGISNNRSGTNSNRITVMQKT